jgi:TonB family protein
MCRSNRAFAIIAMWLATLAVHAQDTVRHVTQEEALKAATSKPQPDYPPMARQLRLQGKVELEVSITSTGAVDNVKILTGNPALTGQAANTLKRWRFDPFLSDGKPARAVAVLAFSFKL